MPLYQPRTKPKRGDVLTAERIAAIEDELQRLGRIRGGAGVVVRHSMGGMQVAGQAQTTKYVGKATSDFNARSGTTVSSGTVDVYWLKDTSTGTIETAGFSLTAWCISSSTMTGGKSIAANQYVTVWQDGFGTWWASPEECS